MYYGLYIMIFTMAVVIFDLAWFYCIWAITLCLGRQVVTLLEGIGLLNLFSVLPKVSFVYYLRFIRLSHHQSLVGCIRWRQQQFWYGIIMDCSPSNQYLESCPHSNKTQSIKTEKFLRHGTTFLNNSNSNLISPHLKFEYSLCSF